MSVRPPLIGAGAYKLFGRGWLAAGFVFLYMPMVALIIYSFNASPLPVVWGGASLRWYRALLTDRDLLEGLWLSLRIAFYTGLASVVLGTLAAFTLVKYRRFLGRTVFSGMVNAPLVMPEVIIGLSLLLMLVTVQRLTGFPERGHGAGQPAGLPGNVKPSFRGQFLPALGNEAHLVGPDVEGDRQNLRAVRHLEVEPACHRSPQAADVGVLCRLLNSLQRRFHRAGVLRCHQVRRQFDHGEGGLGLLVDLGGQLAVRLVVGVAGLGGDREPGGHGHPGVRHLGEARALAAEQVLHGAVAVRLAVAEEVHVAGRLRPAGGGGLRRRGLPHHRALARHLLPNHLLGHRVMTPDWG